MNTNVKRILVYIQEAMATTGQSPYRTYITFCNNCSRHIQESCKRCNFTYEELVQALREAVSLGLICYGQNNVKEFHYLHFTSRGLDMVGKIKSGISDNAPQFNFTACNNVQVGDFNAMNVQEVSSHIESMIEKSTGTPQEKEEAKSVLRVLSENPLFAGSASQILSIIAKSLGMM